MDSSVSFDLMYHGWGGHDDSHVSVNGVVNGKVDACAWADAIPAMPTAEPWKQEVHHVQQQQAPPPQQQQAPAAPAPTYYVAPTNNYVGDSRVPYSPPSPTSYGSTPPPFYGDSYTNMRGDSGEVESDSASSSSSSVATPHRYAHASYLDHAYTSELPDLHLSGHTMPIGQLPITQHHTADTNHAHHATHHAPAQQQYEHVHGESDDESDESDDDIHVKQEQAEALPNSVVSHHSSPASTPSATKRRTRYTTAHDATSALRKSASASVKSSTAQSAASEKGSKRSSSGKRGARIPIPINVSAELEEESEDSDIGTSKGNKKRKFSASKRERNKLSASLYRKRRKLYLDGLEQKVIDLGNELEDKTKRIAELEKEVLKLREENKKLKSGVMPHPHAHGVVYPAQPTVYAPRVASTGLAKHSTMLMMIILLVCLFYDAAFFSNGPTDTGAAVVGRAGRSLLSVDEVHYDAHAHMHTHMAAGDELTCHSDLAAKFAGLSFSHQIDALASCGCDEVCWKQKADGSDINESY